MKFCSQCAGELALRIPPGDDRERYVCSRCATIHYHNPRIITGCLPVHEGRVLLCRRAIEPRKGFWTVPCGFLECGETIAEGAARETMEEACARVELQGLYGIIDIPHISQVYMLYRAHLADLDFAPGAESLETALLAEQDIPWQDLAFPVMNLILEHFFAESKTGTFTLKTVKLDFSQRLRMARDDH